MPIDVSGLGSVVGGVKSVVAALSPAASAAGMTEVERCTLLVLAGFMTFVPKDKMAAFVAQWEKNASDMLASEGWLEDVRGSIT